MRRSQQRRRRFSSDSDVDFDEDEEEEEDDVEEESSSARRRMRMKCLSCKEDYGDHDAGTCRECYVEAGETEDELKREIDDLKSKVNFLRLLCSGSNPVIRANTPCFSDVVLVATGSPDMQCNSPSIPAHRAVLCFLIITMEKDKHFEDKIVKSEEKYMQGQNGEMTAADVEAGTSSANPSVQYAMEKDKHFEEKIVKNEERYMQGQNGEIAVTDVEAGTM